MMEKTLYINLREKTCSDDISMLFPGWEEGAERLAVFGAHDDDPLIGAGYAIAAAQQHGAEIYPVIFCKGDCGYSLPEQKSTIVETRRYENENAYVKFGISKENIVRFEYPDFSVWQYAGNKLECGKAGVFSKIVEFVRHKKITRLLLPNGYREHYDHTSVYEMAIFDAVQAGDPIAPDIGETQKIKSYLQYSVWADFSPEDAMVCGEKNMAIRANMAILCPGSVEERVLCAIGEYTSQSAIIGGLLESRKERFTGEGYMEMYIALDPRPKLDYRPYVDLINGILNAERKLLFNTI